MLNILKININNKIYSLEKEKSIHYKNDNFNFQTSLIYNLFLIKIVLS